MEVYAFDSGCVSIISQQDGICSTLREASSFDSWIWELVVKPHLVAPAHLSNGVGLGGGENATTPTSYRGSGQVAGVAPHDKLSDPSVVLHQ